MGMLGSTIFCLVLIQGIQGFKSWKRMTTTMTRVTARALACLPTGLPGS